MGCSSAWRPRCYCCARAAFVVGLLAAPLVATLAFMAAGFAAVYVIRHLLAG